MTVQPPLSFRESVPGRRPISVLICGLGGQGILTAGEVIGVAAMKAGFHVRKSEVHGMAQRGGSVESHIRFGSHVDSPLIIPGTADFLLSFDPDEGARMRFYLAPDGTDLGWCLGSAAELSNRRFLNMYLTGVLSFHLPIEEHLWIEALHSVLKKNIEQNEAAFRMGRDRATISAGTGGPGTDRSVAKG